MTRRQSSANPSTPIRAAQRTPHERKRFSIDYKTPIYCDGDHFSPSTLNAGVHLIERLNAGDATVCEAAP